MYVLAGLKRTNNKIPNPDLTKKKTWQHWFDGWPASTIHTRTHAYV